MKVEQLMTRMVATCRTTESLYAAARIMWENDGGCVPVVSEAGGGARGVGMVSDRDVCMAAYTQGKPLTAIPATTAISKQVCSCRPTDALSAALTVLRTNQLHRLPVVDAEEHLVGMVSIADIAREAAHEHGRATPEVRDGDISRALEAISQPSSPRAIVRAA
jgi:CBS domain-containing protein